MKLPTNDDLALRLREAERDRRRRRFELGISVAQDGDRIPARKNKFAKADRAGTKRQLRTGNWDA